MTYPKWSHFPKDLPANPIAVEITKVFNKHKEKINSIEFGKSGPQDDTTKFTSNYVLDIISADLRTQIEGFETERFTGYPGNRKGRKKLKITTLFGDEGIPDKTYDPDGLHRSSKLMFECEGRMTIPNNAALKDLFKACIAHNIEHLVIAVPQQWIESNGKTKSEPYKHVVRQYKEIQESRKFSIPLESVTVIGF